MKLWIVFKLFSDLQNSLTPCCGGKEGTLSHYCHSAFIAWGGRMESFQGVLPCLCWWKWKFCPRPRLPHWHHRGWDRQGLLHSHVTSTDTVVRRFSLPPRWGNKSQLSPWPSLTPSQGGRGGLLLLLGKDRNQKSHSEFLRSRASGFLLCLAQVE